MHSIFETRRTVKSPNLFAGWGYESRRPTVSSRELVILLGFAALRGEWLMLAEGGVLSAGDGNSRGTDGNGPDLRNLWYSDQTLGVVLRSVHGRFGA